MAKKRGISIKTTIYATFRGADFSTDPTLVDRTRSPLCTNIMSDAGGMPQKRPGWRTIKAFDKPIWGIHYGVFNSTVKKLVHMGTKLYEFTDSGTVTTLVNGMPQAKSRSAFMGGKLWIVTGSGFYCYDGTLCQRVDAMSCYIPTILITRQPSGGGTSYENVNLITPWRKEQFQTDGSTRAFVLSGTVDAGTTVRAWVWGTETTAFTVSGDTVTFTTAPAAPSAGSADGVVIQYAHTVSGYADRINKCTVISTFGVTTNDRIVLSGNGDMRNIDWMSGFEDPTYWPDIGYSELGSNDTAIMGYLRIGQQQAILKEDNGQDTSVFLRSGYLNDSGEAIFTTAPCMAGVGAVSQGSFRSLNDDALFLSRTGVRAIATQTTTSEKITQARSGFIDPKLCEENLSEAESCTWNGMYMLAFENGHAYLLDGRQNMSYRSEDRAYGYEGFYWENIHAVSLCCMKVGAVEELYFGTPEGKLCKFNTDLNGMQVYADDDEGISAVWGTVYDDDGSPSYYKTLLKKGCCVTIKPYNRSSATVYFRTDRAVRVPVAEDSMDIFSWEDIDFERFTFNSDDSPQEIYFAKKVKNYKRLQIIVKNEEKNEGFGVYKITKHYVYGNFSKRRG